MTWTDDLEGLRWREDLVEAGFSDDGAQLRGAVNWEHPKKGSATARVEVDPGDNFPFAPPHVRVLDAGLPLELTFHIDRPAGENLRGNLCLWEDSWGVDDAPWLDTQALLERIAGWLVQTAAGWPEDDSCDLERYLVRENTLVLYDTDPSAAGLFRAEQAGGNSVSVIAGLPGPPPGARQPMDHRKPQGAGRPPESLGVVWVCDVGAVDAPIRSWPELLTLLSADAARVKRDAEWGLIRWMLLGYSRGGRRAVLALHLYSSQSAVDLRSCESAHTGRDARMLRAGRQAAALARGRVAIVGCGAVGSFAADSLFRSGVRQLTLRDPQTLRPGNVVRHLAGLSEVGQPKVAAVRRALREVDRDTSAVSVDESSVSTLDQAIALVLDHDVVIDATGSARATSLLSRAAGATGHVVVSACVQRDGGVVRVDRMPPRDLETYLPPLARVDDSSHPRERGCGSPVSLTPPGAVVAAAELACRVVIDELTESRSLPASLADVRWPQQEAPFDHLGLVQPHPAANAEPE